MVIIVKMVAVSHGFHFLSSRGSSVSLPRRVSRANHPTSTATVTSNAIATGLIVMASQMRPYIRASVARVPPQPGQGMPVIL